MAVEAEKDPADCRRVHLLPGHGEVTTVGQGAAGRIAFLLELQHAGAALAEVRPVLAAGRGWRGRVGRGRWGGGCLLASWLFLCVGTCLSGGVVRQTKPRRPAHAG